MLELLLVVRSHDGIVHVVQPHGGVVEGVVESKPRELDASLSELTDPPLLGIRPPPGEFGAWVWEGRTIRHPTFGYSFVGSWRRPTSREARFLCGDGGKIGFGGTSWKV